MIICILFVESWLAYKTAGSQQQDRRKTAIASQLSVKKVCMTALILWQIQSKYMEAVDAPVVTIRLWAVA